MVSLLGILVNLVAIPLVLVLALPLGEAAVFAQALSLTPVAQALLFVGKLPLWLGYQVIQWGAKVPGSAIIRTYAHLADDRRLLCHPDPGLLSPAQLPDLDRGGPGGDGFGDRGGPASGHGAPGPGSDLPGRLWGAGGGGGEPGEPAAGGVGGSTAPAGAAPARGGGRCRDTAIGGSFGVWTWPSP